MNVPRSYLFAPATDAYKVKKALLMEDQRVIIDFEDAVAVSQKAEARKSVEGLLTETGTLIQRSIIRINGLQTPLWEEDLACCSRLGITDIMLPKTEGKDDILALASSWSKLSSQSLHIIALIETAKGVEHAYEIAGASSFVTGLALGAVDLTAELDLQVGSDLSEMLYVRSRMVIAAKAAHLDGPIDSVFTHLNDPDGLIRECIHAKRLGFSGKMAIHPSQLPLIQEAFDGGAGSSDRDKRIVEAFEQAEQEGIAAITVDGEMVDYPVYHSARKRLSKN